MRIGASVLLQNEICVQSYNWSMFRALGTLKGVVDSLEQYQCDEISIIRPVRTYDTLTQFEEDLNVVRNLNTMTPISFGGGIRSIDHLKLLHDLPIERVVLSSAFLNADIGLLEFAKNQFGHQAIQCLLPMKMNDNLVTVYLSSADIFVPIDEIDFSTVEKYANELVIVDVEHEGESDHFNFDIIREVPLDNCKLIISGGIGMQSVREAKANDLASVLIDNKVLHREYSIASYKKAATLC